MFPALAFRRICAACLCPDTRLRRGGKARSHGATWRRDASATSATLYFFLEKKSCTVRKPSLFPVQRDKPIRVKRSVIANASLATGVGSFRVRCVKCGLSVLIIAMIPSPVTLRTGIDLSYGWHPYGVNLSAFAVPWSESYYNLYSS